MGWLVNPTTGDIYTEDTTQGNVVKALEKPYPEGMWFVTDTPDVTHDGAITDIAAMGAFAYCDKLTSIVLPESLTSIGPESFVDTGLTEVTIPNNQCTYYSTSFPSGCVVTGGHLIE